MDDALDATAALCRLLRIPEWAGAMNYEYITQGDLADRLALARALVPEMAVVPLEPTKGMVVAALDRPYTHDHPTLYHGIYRAMVAAAQNRARKEPGT